ncbi:chitin synthase-domain-containing protein [Gorgonomyces haynaldii]|nr:chitin synthase-domain-containing protein [Gorgonomyces haynaldii]
MWVVFSWVMTLGLPGSVLSKFGIREIQQQAWREKVALCGIAFVLSALTIYFIIFFNNQLCGPKLLAGSIAANAWGGVIVRGTMYKAYTASPPFNTLFEQNDGNRGGADVTQVFQLDTPASCTKPAVSKYAFATLPPECGSDCLNLADLAKFNFLKFETVVGTKENVTVSPIPAFEWNEIKRRRYVVLGQRVINLTPYFNQYPTPIANDPVDDFLRNAQRTGDGTILASKVEQVTDDVLQCLMEKYNVGVVSQLPMACIVSQLFSIVLTAVVLGIMFVRFFMALFFSYFASSKLAKEPSRVFNYYANAKAPKSLFNELEGRPVTPFGERFHSTDLGVAALRKRANAVSPVPHPSDLYTVCLVTCYSEGVHSIRGTLDSLAATDYDDRKKLLFVIADGLVKGSENDRSTPEIILDMMEHDPMFGANPKPNSYIAVATGSKQHNMAKVYCGSYIVNGRAVPMICVVKTGTPDEASTAKPGNRGKRDSQLILMNFFSRVALNDRMTPLDYDLFRKIHHITGVTPDFFELCLMVDADTKVQKGCLRYMVNAMHNDPSIMGLCGETRIENKRHSWVTRIQVFEYFISHQMGKAFESIFGGVTCLPGCFSMYRIKSFKDGNMMPVLVNPDIIDEYSTNEVYTLHQKNLLLLGEDRFLTTLMLKTFPKRKTVYVPQAICRTTVPEDFKTLLSQRRRWINSTVHNLMELVKVRDLCGIFCFSMQFLVFMDLLSTAVLPATLVTTYYLIVASIFYTNYADSLVNILMTSTLVLVIFLPAFLVLLTGKRLNYVLWMLIYLVALPIWQLILPVYAFWHFDDFSWGETRKVVGDDHGHDDQASFFDGTRIALKRWDEYEREWRRAIVNSHLKQQ